MGGGSATVDCDAADRAQSSLKGTVFWPVAFGCLLSSSLVLHFRFIHPSTIHRHHVHFLRHPSHLSQSSCSAQSSPVITLSPLSFPHHVPSRYRPPLWLAVLSTDVHHTTNNTFPLQLIYHAVSVCVHRGRGHPPHSTSVWPSGRPLFYLTTGSTVES